MRMTKNLRKFTLTLIAGTFLMSATPALACSPVADADLFQAPEVNFAKYETVFLGKLEYSGDRHVVIDVMNTLKGDLSAGEQIFKADNMTSCGFMQPVGAYYVVYLNDPKVDVITGLTPHQRFETVAEAIELAQSLSGDAEEGDAEIEGNAELTLDPEVEVVVPEDTEIEVITPNADTESNDPVQIDTEESVEIHLDEISVEDPSPETDERPETP